MTIRHISTMIFMFASIMTLDGCAGASEATGLQGQETTWAQETESRTPASQVSVWSGSMIPGVMDGPVKEAEFIRPYGICGGPDGGILVVDCYANLLKISDGDMVKTLAGNADTPEQTGYPMRGYYNSVNADALFNRPRFAAVSKEGAVVISDTGNHRIRVMMKGSVRFLAGAGEQGYLDGDYRDAQFNTPSGVALAADGTVYVADTLNHCIRMISPEGIVTTLTGKADQPGIKDGSLSEAQFCEPNDIEFGPDGALYVVDKGNQRIRRIAEGSVTTVAGSGTEIDPVTGYLIGGYKDGAAGQALFQYPTGLCITAEGRIYVADTGNNCIREISPSGEVSTLAGTGISGNVSGSLGQARFNQPVDVFAQEGKIYVSDSYNHVIRMIELMDHKEGGNNW